MTYREELSRYEVQLHRDFGHDESFEAETLEEAERLIRSERDADVRRIVILDTEDDRLVDERIF
jgi:hypothetical protein